MESKISNKCNSLNLQYAFIDESGNYGYEFDKPGVTTHFIITAIIINEDKVEELETKVEDIRKKHFQTGEMKSSDVGNNDLRRLKILEDICKLDFHVFTVVVDKKKIILTSGLRYKPSYIKFLNDILHKELYTAYPKLQMIAVEHGRTEFMQSFIKYVSENHQPTLLDIYEFSFTNSKSQILVQLADFICGTIAKGYEKDERSEKYTTFMNLLRNKIVRIKLWPEEYENYLLNTSNINSNEVDEVIYEQGIRLANAYIEKNENSDIFDIQVRVLFLKYLKTMLISVKPDRYISSMEILNNLNILKKTKLSNHYLRTRIVAKLRDEGVIIASSPHGYKLPITEKDLYDYINQSSSVILPMLDRLQKCREQIKVTTKNELDLFNKDEYKKLKRYFDN